MAKLTVDVIRNKSKRKEKERKDFQFPGPAPSFSPSLCSVHSSDTVGCSRRAFSASSLGSLFKSLLKFKNTIRWEAKKLGCKERRNRKDCMLDIGLIKLCLLGCIILDGSV